MENDEWICCNCGVVTLDRNGRCPICRADNVAPFRSLGSPRRPISTSQPAEEQSIKCV